MSNQHPQQDPSTTLGVGGVTSGQQGATPAHETQQETGGSGGDGLTRNQSGETANAPTGAAAANAPTGAAAAGAPAAAAPAPGAPAAGGHVEAQDSAMTNIGRGPQDTRPDQAGPGETGLGTPETGGNQDRRDLPPSR